MHDEDFKANLSSSDLAPETAPFRKYHEDSSINMTAINASVSNITNAVKMKNATEDRALNATANRLKPSTTPYNGSSGSQLSPPLLMSPPPLKVPVVESSTLHDGCAGMIILLTAGAFAFLGVFLWVLTVFKIIEIRMSDVSSFFGRDFTLAPTSHGKRRQFSWDAEAKAGWEPCEVLVQPVPQAGSRHGLSPLIPGNEDRLRSSALPNDTGVTTATPFEMMEEAATLVSDEEEGGKKYRRVSIGGTTRKRSFEKEKEGLEKRHSK